MAETLTVRQALETESALIRDLIHLVGINPMDLDWRHFVVAVDLQGQVIGCGQLKPHREAVIELASIAVRPELRNRGIARALIERLLADGPRPLYLTCLSSMQPFYARWGFLPLVTDEMPVYFRRLVRLANIMLMFRRAGESLAVMKLE